MECGISMRLADYINRGPKPNCIEESKQLPQNEVKNRV